MEWFFYNLVILIKLCKIWYLNLEKVLLFPRNQTISLKNWKLWRAPTTTKFNIFCWNFAHGSYLIMSTKGCSGFCLFRSWVIKKYVKNEYVETRSFVWVFANNSRSKKNLKKSRTHFCRHWWVGNVCEVSAKTIELYGSWSSPKLSIFQTKNLVSRKQQSFVNISIWGFAILNKYYQVIIKSVHKNNYINHASHLKDVKKLIRLLSKVTPIK